MTEEQPEAMPERSKEDEHTVFIGSKPFKNSNTNIETGR